MNSSNTKERFGSKLGFILATSGAAVGLGNIQRFPYLASENGGAAFLFVYLLCVLILGIPLVLVEFSLGRSQRKSIFFAISEFSSHPLWNFVGILPVLTSFFILSYYIVLSGWTAFFSVNALFNYPYEFSEMTSSWSLTTLSTLAFVLLSAFIVSKGIKKGIEKASKILMPILVFLLLALVARCMFLDGTKAGLQYFLNPDFSQITPKVIVFALSQAFFSLCVGEAVLVTYGSYVTKEDDLLKSSLYISLFDTLIAVLSGLIIFPLLFTYQTRPDEGMTLVFKLLPSLFKEIMAGQILGFMFFVLLSLAALTTCISLMQISVQFLQDQKWFSCSKRNSVILTIIAVYIFSIPSQLSEGGSSILSQWNLSFLPAKNFLDLMDLIWGNFAMVINGLFLTLFVGWYWGADKACQELKEGSLWFARIASLWSVHIKFIAPVLILFILANLF